MVDDKPETDGLNLSGSNPVAENQQQPENKPKRSSSAWPERLLGLVMWLVALSLVFMAFYIGWQRRTVTAATLPDTQVVETVRILPTQPPADVDAPAFDPGTPGRSILRRLSLHTIIPSRPREEVVTYTVTQGDSVFAIAKNFNLEPETILWANYDQLQDAPDSLGVGMVLNIPPVDGVYYEWQAGDTIDGVAAEFEADVEEILNWSGNDLDLTNPEVEEGQFVMIPGGEREFRSWIVPQIARGSAGVSKSVYGPGACEGSYEGVYGGGGFIWPAANHFLSGNDFWSGHLGIDIAGGTGDSVLASDSGVVVFAGWATGGYGYMIMIDHGTGYQTLYAHLSAVNVGCGQSVYQGGYIGGIGSTGNSTGSHLHFEVRLYGQFVNPWHVLP
jgi:murein DD-endopeptidase MepM/ murein hydrolase activator NlpD